MKTLVGVPSIFNLGAVLYAPNLRELFLTSGQTVIKKHGWNCDTWLELGIRTANCRCLTSTARFVFPFILPFERYRQGSIAYVGSDKIRYRFEWRTRAPEFQQQVWAFHVICTWRVLGSQVTRHAARDCSWNFCSRDAHLMSQVFVSRRHLQLSQSFLWAKEHSRIVMRMSEELFRNHVDGGIYATSAPGSHSQLAPSNIVSIHNAQPAPELIDTTSLGQSSSSPIHIPQFISKDLSSFRHLFDRPILQSIDSSTKSDTSYSGTSPPSYSKWKRSFKEKPKE